MYRRFANSMSWNTTALGNWATLNLDEEWSDGGEESKKS